MKKLALLSILLLGLMTPGFAANQGISVGSPYLVTQWCIGKNLDINWSKWGDWTQLNQDPGNQQVSILLVQVGVRAHPRVIAASVPNSGTFDWTIAGDVIPGEYHVRVVTLNKLFKSQSEVFTIKSCQKMLAVKEPQLMTRTLEHAALSIGRIAGRASASTQGNLIAGRKIRVLLKKAGATITSAEYTLDAQGGADYQFTHQQMGTYDVSVEKVSTPVPADALNVCFKGTEPIQRTVVIAGGSMDVPGMDFAILYDIAFNMKGLCW